MTDSAHNKIRIIQPGSMTLVQDQGRIGSQQLGVSVSGALDADSLAIGNRLVGNDRDAAALEVLLGGLEVQFLGSAVFALTGANSHATLDSVPLSINVSYTAHAGSRLVLGIVSSGLRSYVAINGGIDVPVVLGSRSTHIASKMGGCEGRALVEGDVLHIGKASGSPGVIMGTNCLLYTSPSPRDRG